METNLELVMLGAAPETRGSIASVVEIYRQQGLFKRWPIHYIATRSGGGRLDNAQTALRGLRRFAALLVRHRRLVVHAHCTAGAGFWREAAFLELAAAARCPAILHLHGAGFDRFHDEAGSASRALIRRLLEHAFCVIAPSEAQRAWARAVAREARVTCVPSPVPAFGPAPQDMAERSNTILFLGGLAPERGIFDLLEAVAALRAAIPDVRLVCAGEGDRAGVARYAERRGIGDAVKFTGWVGPSGKRALLENAAVFALPCYSAGLPMSLLEAMSAGVPAVAAPVGAIPEVIADGASGFLVAPGDAAALSRVLRKLLLDRALGKAIGAAARETARLRFAPERVLPRLEEIYADAGLSAAGIPLGMRKVA